MKTSIALTGLCCALWITGCSQQATEEVSQSMDAAAETATDALSDASEAVSEAEEAMEEKAGETIEAAKVVADDAAAAAEEAKDAVEDGMAGLVEKATAALSSVEGGPALLKQVTGFFDSAKETLGGITDAESAQAAVAKLGDLGGSLEEMSASMSALPEEAKAALASVIEKGHAAIQAIVEKANAIPGVKEVIQPKVDEVLQKLAALTGKE